MAQTVSLPACVAEFIAMTLFVIIGCGSAMGMAGGEGWILQVSLTFGLAITSLAYSIGHFSGGHINCAVTLGLVLTGNCPIAQGAANFAAQMLGSLTGAAVLCSVYPPAKDLTGGLGSNGVSEKFAWNHALMAEVFGTFLLVFVVLQTACHPKSEASRPQACIAIGFAVFLAHTVLIPIDGCSINPTRSFGPAVVAQMRYPGSKSLDGMWIFWAGPLLGAALAAATYEGFRHGFPEAFDTAGSGQAEGKVVEDKGQGIGDLGLDDICIGMAEPEEKDPLSPPTSPKAPPTKLDVAPQEPPASPRDGKRPGADDSGVACCMFFRTVTAT